jgi:hypothetical protein
MIVAWVNAYEVAGAKWPDFGNVTFITGILGDFFMVYRLCHRNKSQRSL